MISKRYSLRILFILFFSFNVHCVVAQPTLPDIAGSADKGIVILSWVCQYTGIKSITVLHSADSMKNYTQAGHVKNKDKGLQAFVDGHPAPGKNFYKLTIAFSSGLSWTSNHCSVYIDKAMPEKSSLVLPENDLLQKFVVTDNISKTIEKDTIVNTIISNETNKAIKPAPVVIVPAQQKQKVNNSIDTTTKQEIKHKVMISYVIDSGDVVAEVSAGNGNAVQQKKKIVINFNDPAENSISFIRSRFIYIDSVTGHVDMYLPDDVKSHHYSVKFYDSRNHVVIDLPKITTPKIIFDKRNFQRSGIYKFILRKDVTEFEEGYIEIP